MNKYTVYTEFMHSKTVYLTFNLKRMIFQSLESEKFLRTKTDKAREKRFSDG